METPKKIYLVNDDLNTKREWYKTKQVGFDTTEYIRADAIIKDACEWLKKNRKNYSSNALGEEYFIEDFKNYMKGK